MENKIYKVLIVLLGGNGLNKNNLAQLFFEIPVQEYTLNFLTERQYSMILETLLPQIDKDIVKETAKQYLYQACTIKEFHHFFRVWIKALGSDEILALATGAKSHILNAISINALTITKNHYETKKQIQHIASILGWEKDLYKETDRLNNGVKVYAANFYCLNCQSKGMEIFEDVLVCIKCGASWEL